MTTRIILFFLLLAACKTTSDREPVVETEKQTSEPASKSDSATKSQPEPKKEVAQFPGTPFDEEHRQIELKWKKDGSVTLRSSCDNEPDAETIRTKRGGALQWEEAVTFVEEGVALTAKKQIEFNLSEPGDSGEGEKKTVAKGGAIEVLKYDGEGFCNVRFDGAIGYAACPDPTLWEGKGWDGSSYRNRDFWCVKIEGGKGWLRIDDSIEVVMKESM